MVKHDCIPYPYNQDCYNINLAMNSILSSFAGCKNNARTKYMIHDAVRVWCTCNNYTHYLASVIDAVDESLKIN